MKTKDKSISKSTASTSSMRKNSGADRDLQSQAVSRKTSTGNSALALRREDSLPSSLRGERDAAASSRPAPQAEKKRRITRTRLGAGLTESRSDWARVDAFTDEEIEQMAIEDGTADIDWTKAKLVLPKNKESIHLRIDPDVLAWFRQQGPGHLSRINAVLRNYYEAHRRTDQR